MPHDRPRTRLPRRPPWARYAAFPFLALLPSCSEEGAATQAPLPPAPVVVARAVTKDVPLEVRGFGHVEAVSTVAVKPQVEGLIVEVSFREGDEVSRGDLLFRIDPRPFEAEVKKAEANLLRDAAQAERAKAEADRAARLHRDNLTSKDEYDLALANAKAQEAAVEADRAAVDFAKLRLEYATIRSPVDGRTGSLRIYAGNVVKENETTLVTILQVKPIHVAFSVPEQHLGAIRRHMAGGPLRVRLVPSGAEEDGASDGGRPGAGDGPDGGFSRDAPLEGTLDFVDNMVDPTTGMIRLKALFPNDDRRLWPGEYVEVSLLLATLSGKVVVPSQAVIVSQEGENVFVLDEATSTVQVRPVVRGISVGGETVIEKGLRDGETAVTEGQLRLLPGRKVEIKGAPAATDRPSPATEDGPAATESIRPEGEGSRA